MAAPSGTLSYRTSEKTGAGLFGDIPSPNALTGALLIGCYFAISLYGLIGHQVYRYYRMYPNDALITKCMVGSMWLFDTLHSIFIMHTCYFYMVTNYLNPLALLSGVWSLRLSIPLTVVVALIARAFSSRRIYLFSKQLWIPVIIMIFTIAPLAFAIATTVLSYEVVTFMKFERFTWLICLTLGSNMIADVVITVSQCWYLQRSKTGFEKTDNMIDRLLLYVTNTGVLTIMYNTAVLICAIVMSNNLIYVGMFFVISKLYMNSMLTVLNSRRGLVHNNMVDPFDLNTINHIPSSLNELRPPMSPRLWGGGLSAPSSPYPISALEMARIRKPSFRPQQDRRDSGKIVLGL